jgi:hypothetical protein
MKMWRNRHEDSDMNKWKGRGNPKCSCLLKIRWRIVLKQSTHNWGSFDPCLIMPQRRLSTHQLRIVIVLTIHGSQREESGMIIIVRYYFESSTIIEKSLLFPEDSVISTPLHSSPWREQNHHTSDDHKPFKQNLTHDDKSMKANVPSSVQKRGRERGRTI